MPRFYLIISFCGFALMASGQNLLAKYLDAADEKYAIGDYFYALKIYEKAMQIDSNTIDILWKFAETHRAYKDYRKAAYYYAKVYDRELGKIYPESILKLGLMQKQNGSYDLAIETFKKAKKKYSDNRRGYLYRKSRQELESALWAKSYQDILNKGNFIRLPETVNTKNSEFGHGVFENKLIFSSLRADSISANEEVYEKQYITSLYQSEIKQGRFLEANRRNDLYNSSRSSGNAALSLDKKRMYFSSCEDSDGTAYQCKIVVAKRINDKWSEVDTLGEIINVSGANTTMPAIGEIDGKEVLFFASNRKDETEGGLDIFYSFIKNGNQFSRVRSLRQINSLDNDITPFWDNEKKRLYFASTWPEGFGGYDVFYSELKDGRFHEPVNVGQPINSPANDLYFFRKSDTNYVTSNRIGVLYSKNITCCSDIFAFYPPIVFIPPTPKETLEELSKRLPVTLYFHNDIPNPDSWDTLTSLNYITTYNDYTAMLPLYKKEYAAGLPPNKAEEEKEDIENFFTQFVDQGVRDLALFRDLLLEELKKGVRIKVSVRGFASPLAKTEYNVNLTKRRISSLINYLREYDNGVFVPYLNGKAENNGLVVFEQIPFGEYNADQLISDNPKDMQNSVYSRAAASERKIEIQSVSYLDSRTIFPLACKNQVFNAGVLLPNAQIEAKFEITNQSDSTIELENIDAPEYFKIELAKRTLKPKETIELVVQFNTKGFVGHTTKHFDLNVKGYSDKIRLFITTELQ